LPKHTTVKKKESMADTQIPPQPGTIDLHEVEHTDTPPVQDKLVPVSEAIRYRKRAQTAEQSLEDLNEELQALQAKLNEAGQTITVLERRQQMDALLTESDSVDLEAARLLTEHAVELMEEPDIKLAIEDLKRSKPYLFRRRAQRGATSMPPSVGHEGQDPADLAADQAIQSGDRRDLLRYLRLRRQT
jgi:hypothetical protein